MRKCIECFHLNLDWDQYPCVICDRETLSEWKRDSSAERDDYKEALTAATGCAVKEREKTARRCMAICEEICRDCTGIATETDDEKLMDNGIGANICAETIRAEMLGGVK